jgi:hypothetical protein
MNSAGGAFDMTESSLKPTDEASAPHRKRHYWKWFAAGFVLTFVIVALFVPAYGYDGQRVRQMPLGQYYAREIQRAWTHDGMMGPASGDGAVAQTALEHVLVSIAGGGALVAVGWIVRRFSLQRGRRDRN